MTVNNPGDKTAGARNVMWDRRISGFAIDTAGGAGNVDVHLAPGKTVASGLAIITLNDTHAPLRGSLVYEFFFDGTNLNLSLLLGSDVTGGGTHLTVANSNTYVAFTVASGAMRAIGAIIASFTGFVSVDFFVLDR